MLVLGLDTSGDVATLALVEEDRVQAEDAFPSRRRLSQSLVPRLQRLMEDCGVTWTDLSALAVGRGPGSFTGLRIGVVTAKALAHATGLPVLGITGPEALAAQFAFIPDLPVWVMQEALRDEVFLTVFERGAAGELRETGPCAVTSADTALARAADAGGVLFCGDAVPSRADRIRAALGDGALLAPPLWNAPRASLLALRAIERLDAGEEPPDLHALRPLYVRPSQAEALSGIDLGLA